MTDDLAGGRDTIVFEEYTVGLMLVAPLSAIGKRTNVDWKTLDAIMQRSSGGSINRDMWAPYIEQDAGDSKRATQQSVLTAFMWHR